MLLQGCADDVEEVVNFAFLNGAFLW